VALLVSLLFAAFAPAQAPRAMAAEGDQAGLPLPGDLSSLLIEVYNLLRHNSIKKPDPADLVGYAIQGMITGLRDYYAAYYTPEDMKDFISDVEGAFGGIGVTVQEDKDGYLIVVNTLPGFAAERAGMLPGDRIIAVDGESIEGEGLQAATRIRGEPGTTVVLTVAREGEPEPLTIEVVRELITLASVTWDIIEQGSDRIGYIQILCFDGDTDREFDEALQSVIEEGARSIILDLRNNPGGLLDTCTRMAERLLPKRHPILRVQWARSSQMIRSRTGTGYEPLEGVPYDYIGRFPYPVAVLINRYSASASEILAASLQEWGVARLFGEKTYGKGSVQTIYTLPNGSGIKITTATWTSGLGREIDGVGVTPDETIVSEHSPANEPLFLLVTDRWVFRRGSQGSDIVNLQARLNQLGYDSGPEDGVFGPLTEAALKKFQAAVGLPQTGVTDKATVEALNKARVADHPAGKAGQVPGGSGASGDGSAGSGNGSSGSGGSTPDTWPEVTGDQVLDRAIQWLLGQVGG